MNDKLNMHERAVKNLSVTLNRYRHSTKKSPTSGRGHPNETYYDLLVDGKIRCEVKSGLLRKANRTCKGLSWTFSLHRHGVINTRPLELYALHCNDGGKGIWFFVPAAEVNGKKTIYISPRSIANGWWQWIDRYDLFGTGVEVKR